jgi:hypothetical protein
MVEYLLKVDEKTVVRPAAGVCRNPTSLAAEADHHLATVYHGTTDGRIRVRV